MTGRLTHICRHPVKSVGYEELEGALLERGRALAHDREWAISHQAAKFGAEPDGWAPKMNFLRGVSGHELMAIRALRHPDGAVTLTHHRQGEITVALPGDADALIDWLRPLWPENRPAPRALHRVPEQAMTDRPEPFVSVLSLASNADLGARMGADLSIHRWRGNLWIDGWEPWAEHDLVGREIVIGAARLRVMQRITRCMATTVNPDTGRSDADTLGALEAAFGHKDFGVYALIEQGGQIAPGDVVRII
ncbi:MOSC domain-containing protein [Halodurantibacterium flavum]|uniref:MOSC domain-containing protein n=1 Tax=Halodurantibacterium flavum TaxID=1382802 RepID=A0ABW4S6R8_9RHOB